MKADIESKCKEIALRIGIDPQKYVSPEVTLKIANLMTFHITFISTLIKPVIGLNIIFLIASVFLGILYGSILFGVLFFIFSTVISFFSGGLYGLKNFLEMTIKDMNDIVQYSLGIVNRIAGDVERLKVTASSYTVSDILRLVMYGITIPQVEIAINSKIPVFKSHVYRFAEVLLLQTTEKLAENIDKNISVKDLNVSKLSKASELLNPIAGKANQIAKMAVRKPLQYMNIAILTLTIIGSIPLGLLVMIFKS